MQEIILYAATISWLATAITYKSGPPIYWYKDKENKEVTLYLFSSIKAAINSILGKFSPADCSFCLMPWLLAIVWPLGHYFPQFIYVFGILGIGAYLRGGSQEYG